MPSSALYAARKRAGLCPMCGKPKRTKLALCFVDRQKSKVRNARKRRTKPEVVRAARARTYARQRQRALETKTCLTCGDPSDTLNCPGCAAYYRELNAAIKRRPCFPRSAR